MVMLVRIEVSTQDESRPASLGAGTGLAKDWLVGKHRVFTQHKQMLFR